jgi:hypothetical protein
VPAKQQGIMKEKSVDASANSNQMQFFEQHPLESKAYNMTIREEEGEEEDFEHENRPQNFPKNFPKNIPQ